MRLAFIFVLALSLNFIFGQVQAQNLSGSKDVSLVEEMRPTLMKLFGKTLTEKLIGNVPEEKKIIEVVILPPLPTLTVNARSTEVYEKKVEKIILKPELEAKFHYVYIKEIYAATRMTKPSDDEVNKMMNVLSQGGSREGIYHSLVLDAVYAKFENTDRPIKSNAADFAVYFYERYLGKKIERENLKDMNFFSLKRLMADKALDIIDAYGKNREDLEKWYAVMSADLATKFPSIWSSKLRKDLSAVNHKKWASRVPLQHIKSETLIKIHTAINSVM